MFRKIRIICGTIASFCEDFEYIYFGICMICRQAVDFQRERKQDHISFFSMLLI